MGCRRHVVVAVVVAAAAVVMRAGSAAADVTSCFASPTAFVVASTGRKNGARSFTRPYAAAASAVTAEEVKGSVAQLKKVLEREYISFFNPMRTEYYSPTVTFEDPMTSLVGVDQYRNNVDMLASRTLLGRFLFRDASITLFTIEGGQVVQTKEGGPISISDIVTRWSLRVTASILPWQPTARFTGVSVYGVVPSATVKEDVQIVSQVDYWDSINLQPESGGAYRKVEVGKAVSDFVGQLRPAVGGAAEAGPELPYELLRRGADYEVRRYPAFSAAQIAYVRRDEGFGTLGSFTRGMNPLSPAVMQVPQDNDANKSMFWPLTFAAPGQSQDSAVSPPPAAVQKQMEEAQFRAVQLPSFPSRIVAIGSFNDAALEPVVRQADARLRDALQRDGLTPTKTGEASQVLTFAQYDAVYSLGKRRGEVWIELDAEASPW